MLEDLGPRLRALLGELHRVGDHLLDLRLHLLDRRAEPGVDEREARPEHRVALLVLLELLRGPVLAGVAHRVAAEAVGAHLDERGLAVDARALNRKDIAGKTGTTNEQVDAWFAGYNPNLVVTTWIGFDTPHPLHEYAARLALPLWIDFMKTALKGVPEQDMPQPTNVVNVLINPFNGLLARSDQPHAIHEYFRENDIPDRDEEITANAGNLAGQDNQESLF